MTLPPGVDAKQFTVAIRELRTVVGADWVFTSDEDVDLYRDAYTPFYGEPEEYIPCGAVAPNSVEQVQELMRLANRYHIPLWPISTGRNLGYGGAAPRLSGTMVLDLKRMNRVLEVNDTLAYALVEPGVSYFDFYRHLRDNNHKVWMDCPDPGWGSLIGNALEHGLGHTVYRDHFDSHCGMEVVLPTGELMRTGMGAMPNNPLWQGFKYGFGPHVSPIFGQSNFGVVTKMGFWLLPEQDEVCSHIISVRRNGDLEAFLDTMSYLVNSGLIDSSWQLVSPIKTSSDAEIRAAIAAHAPDVELERLGAAKNLGYWSTRIRFYGPSTVNTARWDYVRKRMSPIPDVFFSDGKVYTFPIDTDAVQDEPDDLFAKGGLGIPSLAIFSLGARNGSQGHIFFSPIIPAIAGEYRKALEVFRQAYVDLGLPPLNVVGGWSWYKRTLVLLFNMPITHDIASNQRMRANYKRLVQIGAEHGWSEYRTAPAFMDDVMQQLSFNNHALRRFHETVKDALDPNGILAPGKSGIWPKRLRRTP
jgi:4-cresol dehydrogenase (hydroxylating)